MTDDLAFLPPHEPTWVEGFHVYTQRLSVAPGEEVELRICGEGLVRAEVVRYLGKTVAEGKVVAMLPPAQARRQPIHRGSYVYVERGLESATALSAEVWFRILATAPQCGLIQQRGFCLGLEGDIPFFSVGGSRISGRAVSLKEWHHAVGCFGEGRLRLYLDGQQVGEAEWPGGAVTGGGPLRLGATEDAQGRTCGLFTGDLCGPTLYREVLAPELIQARFREKATAPAGRCAGHWRFDADEGLPCRDTSGEGRHGQPVNYPIRMVPGPRRTEDSDWCTYDPRRDPEFGHAIRLMGDAVVDCRWGETMRWQVPEDAQSGQCGIRVQDERGQTRHVHFIVRPRRPTAPLLCLSTTHTRIAYNFRPFDDERLDYGAYHPHPNYPILGQLLGVRRPATGELWERTTVEFELPFYAWLEHHRIPYDLYSEWDLEAEPGRLNRYRAVAFAGHSEYWTADLYVRLQRFVERGGHILSLSGNTAYWRVSLDRRNGVMEVRKHARIRTAGTTCDPLVNAAHHHQLDALPGATMREAGYPEVSLLGGASNGWTEPPLDGPRAGYEVLLPEHWVFNQPRRVRADFPFALGAAGYETDLSVRTLLERFGSALPRYADRSGRPEPALGQPFDAGLAVLARAKLPDSHVLDYDNELFDGEMGSEMLLWERPGHGLIFAAGSVLAAHLLPEDENFSNMLFNIMERMGLEVPD